MECLCLACWCTTCVVWGCKRCSASGRTASLEWEEATAEEFQDVPRICRIVLAVYERDLANPIYADRLKMDQVVKFATYKDTAGMSPPYIIYIDHEARDICLAIRGLNMINLPDYKVLMDHKRGAQRFDGGYVHRGLLQSAAWLLDHEFELLHELAKENPDYTLTFAGHSLGSGIVAMMAVLLRKHIHETTLTPDRLRCYAIAPARSTSLNLAVRYSDTVHSIVLQDDFLPRTSAPIELILGASFCLPCLLCYKFCKDVLISDEAKLKDPTRLYVPGRLYHVLYTEDCSCRNHQPEVKTAVPVDHRFERIIFSRTTVNDHSIVNIEQIVTAAVDGMVDKKEAGEMLPPSEQTMQRLGTMRRRAEEVVQSLEKCKSMGVYNAKDPKEVQDEVTSLSLRMEGVLKSDSFFSRQADEDEAIVDETGGYENGGPRASDGSEARDTADEAGTHENGAERAAEGEGKETQQQEENSSPAQNPLASASGAPAVRRWQEAAERVQKSPTQGSKKWTTILESLLEESEDQSPKKEFPQKKHLSRLPSIAFTGAP